ncbi:hypothetical protein HGA34_03310 [Candidatus Falkowbacteria bacterium]|nr:hypothetical protein [Candidatus Falkowbacteria bacterium]
MKNLLTLKFWFSTRPGDLTAQAQAGMLVFAALLAAIGFYAWRWRKQNPKGLYRKIYGRIMSFGFTNLAINLLLLFFEYEAVPILSMRLWLLIWLISMVAWARLIVRDIQKMPQIRSQIAEDKKLKKYIP